MANYTISIREILQMNKQPNQDLTNISDLLSVGSACIFDKAPLNVISSTYRDKFMTGFLLHFFNEEIGLETVPLWKIALNEKIYNNSDYINLIFTNIDKQLFAEYKVHTIDTAVNTSSEDSESGTGSKTTSNSTEGTETTTNEYSDTDTKTGNNTHSLQSSKAGGGTVTDAKTGTDTVTGTGTVTNGKAGSEINSKGGTDALARTGTDTTTNSGKDEFTPEGSALNTRTGSETQYDRSVEITTNLGGLVTDKNNSVNITSDTPMGSLQNLRTPGGDATGTGVAYQTDGNRSYNYMSGASELGQTTTHEDLSAVEVAHGYDHSGTADDGVETVYNTTDTQSYNNRKDTTKFGKVVQEAKNTTDTTTYNSTDTKEYRNYLETETRNTQDATAYGSTNTQTRNTTDTETATNTDSISESDAKTGESEANTTKSITDSGSEATTNSRTVESQGETLNTGTLTDTTLNWEMLYKSMPLLNKVWELFDDIFMILL